VGERHAFGGHGVAPGHPMVLFGIDERSVQIPKGTDLGMGMFKMHFRLRIPWRGSRRDRKKLGR